MPILPPRRYHCWWNVFPYYQERFWKKINKMNLMLFTTKREKCMSASQVIYLRDENIHVPLIHGGWIEGWILKRLQSKYPQHWAGIEHDQRTFLFFLFCHFGDSRRIVWSKFGHIIRPKLTGVTNSNVHTRELNSSSGYFKLSLVPGKRQWTDISRSWLG